MIYHITSKAEWAMASTTGILSAESLTGEGFIHCCTAEQFTQVANFYFKDRDHLVIIEIDEEKMKADLKWEKIDGHKFPHVYGPIEVSAVSQTAEMKPNEKGIYEFPFKPVLH